MEKAISNSSRNCCRTFTVQDGWGDLRLINPARPELSSLYNPFYAEDDDYVQPEPDGFRGRRIWQRAWLSQRFWSLWFQCPFTQCHDNRCILARNAARVAAKFAA
jgi:hypothetical protein